MGTARHRAGALSRARPGPTMLLWHLPEETASEPREPEEERERPHRRLPTSLTLPFPRRRANTEGRAPGGQRSQRSRAAGERGPSPAGHPPHPRAPGALRCRGRGSHFPVPWGPAALTDSAAAARRRRPSSSAVRRGTRGSGMAGPGWAALGRDTRRDTRRDTERMRPERALTVPRRCHRP